MSERDRELVEQYRGIMRNMVGSSQHLKPVEGVWYIFEKDGERTFISRVEGDVLDDQPENTGFGYLTEVLGWTATSVLIHKVV